MLCYDAVFIDDTHSYDNHVDNSGWMIGDGNIVCSNNSDIHDF